MVNYIPNIMISVEMRSLFGVNQEILCDVVRPVGFLCVYL